jgi:hypothetical protein
MSRNVRDMCVSFVAVSAGLASFIFWLWPRLGNTTPTKLTEQSTFYGCYLYIIELRVSFICSTQWWTWSTFLSSLLSTLPRTTWRVCPIMSRNDPRSGGAQDALLAMQASATHMQLFRSGVRWDFDSMGRGPMVVWIPNGVRCGARGNGVTSTR